MYASRVAVVLSWLSCCGSGVWRYYVNSPNYDLFSTRNTIKLEYEGKLFSEWSVPATCSIKNKRLPKTELRCSSPGIHAIKPVVSGPDLEEERYLSVYRTHICFLWYYKAMKFANNLTQIVVLWIYDPENASPSELLWNASEPSLYSKALSTQFADFGLTPFIYTTLKRKTYFPQGRMKDGKWYVSVPTTANDVLKEIKGNKVDLLGCVVANRLFLLTFPLLTMPEIPGFLPVSSPRGSQLIAGWAACVPSFVVVVADMETFQTNDSFHTWTRIRVPPDILTEDERHNVSDVTLSQDGIFFLISGILYLKNYNTFTRLGSNENLPDGGIIGITSRKWCWINDFLKDKERRSNMAIWTENEVYLGYAVLKFVKIVTTEKLKGLLKMSPTATLTIHNVEYTGHPFELGVLLNYCIICNTSKTIYLVIYNENTIQWVFQEYFALDVTIDTFLIPYFLYSAMPELLLWDRHRIYYYYHNFKDTGVLQTTTEFGNLSRLSQNSIIHNVIMDYYGNIVVKMENNVMFYFKITMKDAIKLHLWRNSTVKSLISFKPSGHMYLIYVFENGKIYAEEYPLDLETRSITFKTKEKCPYVAFHTDILRFSYIVDKRQSLSLGAHIVYPENIGLYIVVESYGPKILERKDRIRYETDSGYSTKTMTMTFSHNINYEAVDDYFKLQNENTGLLLVHMRPSELAKTCPISQMVFEISVGCDASKFIAVKGFTKECLQRDFFYTIEPSYLRDRPSKPLRVKYNWDKYGCPMKVHIREKFHPLIQLYNENGYVEDVEVNFIVWEIHGRDDYSFNNTMMKSGCVHVAQTWNSMIELNEHLPLEEVWGPENYKHCFSYAIGKPGDLTQPYEIINKSNYNHLVWPLDHAGIYVFRVKILDPNYSFCNLTTIFAIETSGLIPSPDGYAVAYYVSLLMLLFFCILILSYFYFMKIYREYIYEPLPKSKRKNKKN